MLKDYGIKNLFVNPLHFTQKQVQNISEKEKIAMNMNSNVIERTLVRYKWNYEKQGNNTDLDYVHDAVQYFESEGFIATVGFEARENHIYDIYHRTYAQTENNETVYKTFFTVQDFINYCFQTKQAGEVIEFAEFALFMQRTLPEGEYNLQTYILSLDRFFLSANQRQKNGFFESNLPKRMTFIELLAYYWRYPTLRMSLLNIDCFYPKLEGIINDEPIPDLDDFGLLKIAFDPNIREVPYVL